MKSKSKDWKGRKQLKLSQNWKDSEKFISMRGNSSETILIQSFRKINKESIITSLNLKAEIIVIAYG